MYYQCIKFIIVNVFSINHLVVDFIIYFMIYVLVALYLNFFIAQFLKFFIQYFAGYDIWTYLDDSFRTCSNNTFYDSNSHYYILDYEYFDISEMIYYHDNFLEPDMLNKDKDLHYYLDLFSETRTREDDDHELYAFLSGYVVPLQHQYYLLEHYWPEADKISSIAPNFYDFKDLESAFDFIAYDYKFLWDDFKQYFSHRHIRYKNKVYETKILQLYFSAFYERYKFNEEGWFKNPNFFYKAPAIFQINETRKKYFWEKRDRTFILEEPTKELCLEKYMTWFILKMKYDELKFDYDAYSNLSPYEMFDYKYYDMLVEKDPIFNILIDYQTKHSHFIETTEEYLLTFPNSNNIINYYINNNLFEKMQYFYLDNCLFDEHDKIDDSIEYIYMLFLDRIFVILTYLFILLYSYMFVFYICVSYYCWFQYFHHLDIEFFYPINYTKLLHRYNHNVNYSDYKYLIFNCKSDNIVNLLHKHNKNYNFTSINIDEISGKKSIFRHHMRNIEYDRSYEAAKEAKRKFYKGGRPLYEERKKDYFFMYRYVNLIIRPSINFPLEASLAVEKFVHDHDLAWRARKRGLWL